MSLERPLDSLSDENLLRRLADLLRQSRRVEPDLVAHIGEVEARRLYARFAAPSMFVYCTDVLHLSEHEAYLRITVARAARAHPEILLLLADGRLHLAAIAKLAPHLTLENRDALLERAVHKTKRQIEEIVADLAPRPDARSLIRRLPAPPLSTFELGPDRVTEPTPRLGPDRVADPSSSLGPGRLRLSPHSASEPAATIQPLAPARYRVQFTADAALRDTLDRLRVLMRSEVPDGDLAAIIGKPVTEKLERLEAKGHAVTRAPRKDRSTTDTEPSSRHVPAAVRRAVRERDGNRCCYRDAQGHRCPERIRLEFHHRHPHGLGGGHGPDNICLMCAAHNRYLRSWTMGERPWPGTAQRARRDEARRRAREVTRRNSVSDGPPPPTRE
jgi:hypothetical protein